MPLQSGCRSDRESKHRTHGLVSDVSQLEGTGARDHSLSPVEFREAVFPEAVFVVNSSGPFEGSPCAG